MRCSHTALQFCLLAPFIVLGVGCADILDLDQYGGQGTIQVDEPAKTANNTYTCNCRCEDKMMKNGGDYPLGVCLPGVATQTDANVDCSVHVQSTLQALSDACRARVDCTCMAAMGSLGYAAECAEACTEDVLETDCSNFPLDEDPFNKATATNTTGTFPVCTVASVDPPTPTPDPLTASGIFGHRTRCEVTGSVLARIDDDEQTQPAQGIVEFDARPCPGLGCATGMSYRLNVDPFEFSGFLGLVTVSLVDITTSGATLPGAAMLDPSGIGQIAPLATLSSGRATRIEEDPLGTDESTSALIGSNVEPIGIVVDWANNVCAVAGTVLGSTNEDSELAVTVNLPNGIIVNSPPTANAGADQTIECTSPDGANVILDASASSDPDINLTIVGWRIGNPFSQDPADELGPGEFGTTYTVLQDFGTESYHLLVIDAFMQASPDSFNATVEDTTPPVISQVTATPNVLWPPDHKFRTVVVDITATDTCDPDPECQVVSVASNEPVNDEGDGNTSPDWIITGAFSVELRSERSGTLSSRVYTIGVECSDDFGNTSASSVNVTVSHDQQP